MLEHIQQGARAYAGSLERFLRNHNLERLCLGELDHIAMKATDSGEFERWLEQIMPQAESLSYITMHHRRLATVRLSGAIACGRFGGTPWLELMEPRPEKVGQDLNGFEHTEFYNPDFATIRSALTATGVPYEDYQNPNHQAVVVRINKTGQEVKFTNARLGQITTHQTAIGEATVLK